MAKHKMIDRIRIGVSKKDGVYIGFAKDPESEYIEFKEKRALTIQDKVAIRMAYQWLRAYDPEFQEIMKKEKYNILGKRCVGNILPDHIDPLLLNNILKYFPNEDVSKLTEERALHLKRQIDLRNLILMYYLHILRIEDDKERIQKLEKTNKDFLKILGDFESGKIEYSDAFDMIDSLVKS